MVTQWCEDVEAAGLVKEGGSEIRGRPRREIGRPLIAGVAGSSATGWEPWLGALAGSSGWEPWLGAPAGSAGWGHCLGALGGSAGWEL